MDAGILWLFFCFTFLKQFWTSLSFHLKVSRPKLLYVWPKCKFCTCVKINIHSNEVQMVTSSASKTRISMQYLMKVIKNMKCFFTFIDRIIWDSTKMPDWTLMEFEDIKGIFIKLIPKVLWIKEFSFMKWNSAMHFRLKVNRELAYQYKANVY